MHICASEPQYVAKSDIPPDVLAKEREIALGQAKADPKNANKPDNIIEKMVQGRLDKFYSEAALLEQPFVRDQAITVGELVTQLTAKPARRSACVASPASRWAKDSKSVQMTSRVKSPRSNSCDA